MIIDNVKIYTEAGTFVSGGIITQGDKITEIYTEAEKENIFKKMNMETEHTAAQCSVQDYSAKNDIDNVLDGKGAYAIPGLIDLHFHGCVGDDSPYSRIRGKCRCNSDCPCNNDSASSRT